MNTKHTPGPWKLAGHSIVTDDDAYCIAVIEDDGGCEVDPDEQEANARLIASAPALLDALKNLLFAVENADETGYVTEHGFIDLDAINAAARSAVESATS